MNDTDREVKCAQEQTARYSDRCFVNTYAGLNEDVIVKSARACGEG